MKIKELIKKFIISEQEVWLKKEVKASYNSSELFPEDRFVVRKLDINNEEDVKIWCTLINEAYDDANYSLDKAHQMLTVHPFLENTETVLVFSEDTLIATVSFGRHKGTSDIGGLFRIAASKSCRRMGIGTRLLKYSEVCLAEKGMKYIREVIKIKRNPSLMMHFKAGYVPETADTVPYPIAHKIALKKYAAYRKNK